MYSKHKGIQKSLWLVPGFFLLLILAFVFSTPVFCRDFVWWNLRVIYIVSRCPQSTAISVCAVLCLKNTRVFDPRVLFECSRKIFECSSTWSSVSVWRFSVAASFAKCLGRKSLVHSGALLWKTYDDLAVSHSSQYNTAIRGKSLVLERKRSVANSRFSVYTADRTQGTCTFRGITSKVNCLCVAIVLLCAFFLHFRTNPPFFLKYNENKRVQSFCWWFQRTCWTTGIRYNLSCGSLLASGRTDQSDKLLDSTRIAFVCLLRKARQCEHGQLGLTYPLLVDLLTAR